MIKKRLVVTNGSYRLADGTDKRRYVTIGHLHENEHGEFITLEAHINLAGLIRKDGETRVFVSLYDNDESGQTAPRAARQRAASTQAPDDMPDDDIPF